MLAHVALACLASGAVAHAQPPGALSAADRDIVRTLTTALAAREKDLPPLTMCGLFEGFYTPLYWAITEYLVVAAKGDPADLARVPRGDRGAAGVAVWESADDDSWEREIQGVYRGPTPWISPAVAADPTLVADMYRLERGDRDRVTVLDCTSGYPMVSLQPPKPDRASRLFAIYLGLETPTGPFDQVLGHLVTDAAWHVTPPQLKGDVLAVSGTVYTPDTGALTHVSVEAVVAPSWAPLRYRYVTLGANGRGVAEELVWGDLTEVGKGGPALARSATWWRFNYAFPGKPPLVETWRFRCTELRPSDPGGEPYQFPRLAAFDEATSGAAAVAAEAGRYEGNKLQVLARDFATMNPPEPPADLIQLRPESAIEGLKKQYGF